MTFDLLAKFQTDLQTKGFTHLRIKVTPKSAKTEFVDCLAVGTLKIRLRAIPEKGRANAELIKFLSAEFQVPKNNIVILSGKTDRLKLVKIGCRE